MSRRVLPAVLLAALAGGVVGVAPAQVIVRKVAVRAGVNGQPVPEKLTDEQALAAAGLKPDGAAELLGYFRQRTLSDADLGRIQAVIARLGAAEFEDRVKAATEAERFGPAAVGPLRTAAQSDPDPEIAYRASECLRRMEKVPHAAVALAAVKALAKLKHPDTAPVLLGFLPLADDDAVADAIRTTLTTVAVRDGKADPALVAALTDPVPLRRAAAGVALVEGGPAGERVRIPDALPKVQAAAKAEADPETRFQLLYALLTVARDKTAIAQIIDLIPELPRGRLWQAEDYLLQLAGDAAPKARLGKSKESLSKARDQWKEWWATADAKTNLTAFSYVPRISGRTLLVLMDFRFGSMGAVVELGPDMKEKWRIKGLQTPMDAALLADGMVAIAEQNSNRVTIRDTAGKVVATRTIGGANRVYGNPQQVQALPNGNLLVTCRNVVVEFKADKDEEVMRYVRNQYDVVAARRLQDGTTALLLQNGPDHCIFVDEKGKDTEQKLKIGMPYYQAHIDEPAKGRLLVTEMNQVAEYDVKDGKKLWTKAVNQPRSVQRLPNGNTLMVDAGTNRLVEIAPEGDEVWSYQPTTGYNVFRAYRR